MLVDERRTCGQRGCARVPSVAPLGYACDPVRHHTCDITHVEQLTLHISKKQVGSSPEGALNEFTGSTLVLRESPQYWVPNQAGTRL
jgi:hypothetical protein